MMFLSRLETLIRIVIDRGEFLLLDLNDASCDNVKLKKCLEIILFTGRNSFLIHTGLKKISVVKVILISFKVKPQTLFACAPSRQPAVVAFQGPTLQGEG